MTPEQRQQLSNNVEKGLLFLWGITLMLFPIFFTTLTTESFVIPKMLFLAGVVLLSLLAWGGQMVLHGQVRIRRTPLDVPILLFLVAVLLSSIFSANRADSLMATAIVVFAGLSYFVLVNLFQRKVALFFLGSLITGGIASVVIAILSHFHIYVLPFVSSKSPTFTTVGNYLDLAVYSAILLPLALFYVVPVMKKQYTARVGVFAIAGVALLTGCIVALSGLLGPQKPLLLPFDTGFQVGFAAISQDAGRVLQSFLFGEGYGTFASVFARFHTSAINTNPQLWFVSFGNSSSLMLELLATTGLIGILSYLFLLVRSLTPVAKKKTNPFFFSLIIMAVFSIILPFSSIMLVLFFFLLAGLTLSQREQKPHEYFDVELKFVALKKGVFAFTTLADSGSSKRTIQPTPIAACVVLLGLVLLLGFYTTIYAISDITFQQSLVAANKNNGAVTYKLQAQAISTFPYRSAYYRIFSQTNMQLASSLLALDAGKSSPSATTTQTAFTLVQQAITTARQATALSPASPIEWQNLSSVYRVLIGQGQNADQFAIQAAQQATILDSANPQEFVNLGGLYYQIGQYDNAIKYFQQAISLKADYANAYYNLGHAYESKGDLQSALAQYQIVQGLVANDGTSSQRIGAEITALQAKIGSGAQATPKQAPTSGTQQPLSLPTQTTPSQNQSGQIPLVTPTPTK